MKDHVSGYQSSLQTHGSQNEQAPKAEVRLFVKQKLIRKVEPDNLGGIVPESGTMLAGLRHHRQNTYTIFTGLLKYALDNTLLVIYKLTLPGSSTCPKFSIEAHFFPNMRRGGVCHEKHHCGIAAVYGISVCFGRSGHGPGRQCLHKSGRQYQFSRNPTSVDI
jgi:hypothetical protein